MRLARHAGGAVRYLRFSFNPPGWIGRVVSPGRRSGALNQDGEPALREFPERGRGLQPVRKAVCRRDLHRVDISTRHARGSREGRPKNFPRPGLLISNTGLASVQEPTCDRQAPTRFQQASPPPQRCACRRFRFCGSLLPRRERERCWRGRRISAHRYGSFSIATSSMPNFEEPSRLRQAVSQK